MELKRRRDIDKETERGETQTERRTNRRIKMAA
jgi:hypothetical protein